MQLIWFDDAILDTYTHAFPLMKKYKKVGVVSVITKSVGNEFKWELVDDEYVMLKCMNIEQLLDLIDNGWKIASHTVTHRRLDELTIERAKYEIIESKNWIITNLGVEPIAFVPPFHVITKEQKRIAEQHYPFVRNGGYGLIFHSITNFGITPERLEGFLKRM